MSAIPLFSSRYIKWSTSVHRYGMFHRSVSTSTHMSCHALVLLMSIVFRFREHMAGVHGEKDFHLDHGHAAPGAPPHRWSLSTLKSVLIRFAFPKSIFIEDTSSSFTNPQTLSTNTQIPIHAQLYMIFALINKGKMPTACMTFHMNTRKDRTSQPDFSRIPFFSDDQVDISANTFLALLFRLYSVFIPFSNRLIFQNRMRLHDISSRRRTRPGNKRAFDKISEDVLLRLVLSLALLLACFGSHLRIYFDFYALHYGFY